MLLKVSRIRRLILSVLSGNHWITYIRLLVIHLPLKLYIIGAWNEPMNAVMKKYAIEMLSYL